MDFNTIQRAEVQQPDTPAPSVPGLTQLREQPGAPRLMGGSLPGQARPMTSQELLPQHTLSHGGLKGQGGIERKVVGISLGGEGFQL